MRLTQYFRIAVALSLVLAGSNTYSAIFDWEAPHELDHRIALKCYLPDGLQNARAIIVLMPGLNQDGRSMALDPEWQALAQHNSCALVASSMTGAQGGIYYEAEHWSGDLLLKGLTEIARQSMHQELENVPLGFWGHSAGGQFNYNFSCWKPERVFAFVVNKGGYYEAVAIPEVRKVPSLWIAGGVDSDLRVGNITSHYAENRRRGAPWGLLIEPKLDHRVGRSKEIGIAFLEEALAIQFDSSGSFQRMNGGGWLADFQTLKISTNSASNFGPGYVAWFPGKTTAEIWKAILQEVPYTNETLALTGIQQSSPAKQDNQKPLK